MHVQMGYTYASTQGVVYRYIHNIIPLIISQTAPFHYKIGCDVVLPQPDHDEQLSTTSVHTTLTCTEQHAHIYLLGHLHKH